MSTTTTTTHTHPSVDGSPPPVEAGVIREAKIRTRHRHLRYAIGITLGVMLLGAGALAMSGGPWSSSEERTSEGIPPIAGATFDDGRILAQWSKFHVGWLYVYADGRVLSYPDRQAAAGHPNGGILERRLSPVGVEMVQTGEVELREFLSLSDALPTAAWSDPSAANYRPSRFALCHAPFSESPPREGLRDVKLIGDQIPIQLRSVLSGTELSFADPVVGPWPGVDCFVLDAREAEVVWDVSLPRDDPAMYPSDANYTTLTATNGAELDVVLLPILPHGGFVQWGG